MDCRHTNLKETSNVQKTIIGKIHSMQWLKNNHLSGHARTQSNAQVTNVIGNSFELNSDNIGNIDQDCNILAHKTELSIMNTDAVWNKNKDIESTLFSNAQATVIQELDENEMLSMAIAESITTTQFKQHRLDQKDPNVSDTHHNKLDDNVWNTVSKTDSDLHDTKEVLTEIDNTVTDISELFSWPQITNNESFHEDNILDMVIAKSIVTAELEQLELVDEDPMTVHSHCNKSNNCAQDSTHENSDIIEEVQPAKMHETECQHDSNNNNDMKLNTQTTLKSKEHKNTVGRNIDQSSTKSVQVDNTKQIPAIVEQKDNNSAVNGESNKSSTSHLILKERTTSTISTPKFNNKYGKTDGYSSRHVYTSKGTRTNDQHYLKQPANLFHTNTDTSKHFNHGTEQKIKYESKKPISFDSDSKKNLRTFPKTTGRTDKYSRETNVQTTSYNTSCNRNRPFTKFSQRNYNYVAQPKDVPQTLQKTLPKLSTNGTRDKCTVSKEDEKMLILKRDSTIYRRSLGPIESNHPKTEKKHNELYRTTSPSNMKKESAMNRTSPTSRSSAEQESTNPNAKSMKRLTNETTKISSNVTNISSVNVKTNGKFTELGSSQSTETVQLTDLVTNRHVEVEIAPVPELVSGTSRTEIRVHNSTKADIQEDNRIKNDSITQNTDTISIQLQSKSENNERLRNKVKYQSSSQKVEPTSLFFSERQNQQSCCTTEESKRTATVQSQCLYNTDGQYIANSAQHITNPHFDTTLNIRIPSQENTGVPQHLPTRQMTPRNIYNQASTLNRTMLQCGNMPSGYTNQYNEIQIPSGKVVNLPPNLPPNLPLPSATPQNVESINMFRSQESNTPQQNNHTMLPHSGFYAHPAIYNNQYMNLPIQDMTFLHTGVDTTHFTNLPGHNSKLIYNNIPKNMHGTNYLPSQMFCIPYPCIQSWNQNRYPNPLPQTSPHSNYTNYTNQDTHSGNFSNNTNCPPTTPVQQDQFYQFVPQPQSLEVDKKYVDHSKFRIYSNDNQQNLKTDFNNAPIHENTLERQMLNSDQQYFDAAYMNDYQKYVYDTQHAIPAAYPISGIHTQNIVAPNYFTLPEQTCTQFSSYGMNQDAVHIEDHNVPPMISPKDCMNYGAASSKNADNMHNRSVRSDMKFNTYKRSYSPSANYNPAFRRDATYPVPVKQPVTKLGIGRGRLRPLDS